MNFYRVLSDAIDDLLKYGYDSEERVAYWQGKLQEAAEAIHYRGRRADDLVRQSMYALYTRMVDKRGILRRHKGLSRWGIDRVRPALRSELDRRIVAALGLIKLNKEEAAASMARRFVGWATSIPIGGISGPQKAEAKSIIKKSLSSLPFETRRVNIDQGHKLVSSINDIVAVGNGAIACTWHSHYRQLGYKYRIDHKNRDGNVYLIRGSSAQLEGLVKPGKAGYYDDVTAAGEEVNCRCWVSYIYNIGSLPDDMLTAKGRDKLRGVRAAMGRGVARE